jgi:hypothetical protein
VDRADRKAVGGRKKHKHHGYYAHDRRTGCAWSNVSFKYMVEKCKVNYAFFYVLKMQLLCIDPQAMSAASTGFWENSADGNFNFNVANRKEIAYIQYLNFYL